MNCFTHSYRWKTTCLYIIIQGTNYNFTMFSLSVLEYIILLMYVLFYLVTWAQLLYIRLLVFNQLTLVKCFWIIIIFCHVRKRLGLCYKPLSRQTRHEHMLSILSSFGLYGLSFQASPRFWTDICSCHRVQHVSGKVALMLPAFQGSPRTVG